jgi:hypothetical protein
MSESPFETAPNRHDNCIKLREVPLQLLSLAPLGKIWALTGSGRIETRRLCGEALRKIVDPRVQGSSPGSCSSALLQVQ